MVTFCDFCDGELAVALYAALNGEIYFICKNCLDIIRKSGFHYRLLTQCEQTKEGGEDEKSA